MARRLRFDRERCLACRSCELACAVAHSRSGALLPALGEDRPPRRRVTIARGPRGLAALRCLQCDEPLCLFSCKSGALHWSADGVAFDESRCVGCLMCLMVGPHGMRPDGGAERVVRCDVCDGRETPACVEACPTRALRAGAEPRVSIRTAFAGRLVIVGSSAAGLAACEAAREIAPACAITVVSADERPYSRPLLPYVLANHLTRDALDWRDPSAFEPTLPVHLVRGRRAVRLSLEEKTVWLDDGGALPFDALVIATGARPAALRVPGSGLPGVLGLRDLEHLDEIEGRARTARAAVVVGGGNVGLQACEALVGRGLAVTLVVRSPHLLSQMLDEEAAHRVAALFAQHGVRILTGRDVVEIAGNDAVERVRLDDGEVVEAGLVVVGKGIEPNVEWLASSGIRVARGVLVDRAGRTNVGGIFAAGDCAETKDPATGQSAASGIWPVAYEAGRTAGFNAVGADRVSPGPLRMNASRFFGTPVISIGDARRSRMPGATAHVVAAGEGIYRKLVLDEDRLVGAILYGDVSGAGLYYRLYRDGVRLGGTPASHLDDRRTEWTASLLETP